MSERSAEAVQLIVTCEHGGNRIPRPYWPLFKPHKAALASHHGFDPGALSLARDVAKHFDAELIYSTTSRLLVELNRSPNHRQVLSEATRSLSREERQALFDRYYWPYRNWVESQVEEAIADGQVRPFYGSEVFRVVRGPKKTDHAIASVATTWGRVKTIFR